MSVSKVRKGKGANGGKAKWAGFIPVYLNPEEKREIKKALMSEDAVLTFLEDMCASGYKVSVSYSTRGSFYSVTAYGNESGHVNEGWAMTLRHSDLRTAFTALAFTNEHHGLLGDWEGKTEKKDELDW